MAGRSVIIIIALYWFFAAGIYVTVTCYYHKRLKLYSF